MVELVEKVDLLFAGRFDRFGRKECERHAAVLISRKDCRFSPTVFLLAMVDFIGTFPYIGGV